MRDNLKVLILAAAALALCAGAASSAFARPEYARKEGVACQYCHLSGSPGSVDPLSRKREPLERNVRGMYYGSHNHTFVGYVERAEAVKASGPSFRFAWKEDFKGLIRRVAVGDVTGDGKQRLITLADKPDEKNASTLEVLKWDGKAFVSEFTGDVRTSADRLAVGRFGGLDKPAIIATGDAIWTWNGKSIERKASTVPLSIIGVTRLHDGTERLLIAPTSQQVLAYRINLTSVRQGDFLVDPVKAPSPPEDVWGDMHSTREFLQAMGVPEPLAAGGIFGIWDIKKYNVNPARPVYFIYQMDRDKDIAADPKNPGQPKVTYNNNYWVKFRETRTGETTWTSPKLPGEGLDIAIGDPRGGDKAGILILFNGILSPTGGPSTKGRTLVFFAMD